MTIFVALKHVRTPSFVSYMRQHTVPCQSLVQYRCVLVLSNACRQTSGKSCGSITTIAYALMELGKKFNRCSTVYGIKIFLFLTEALLSCL